VANVIDFLCQAAPGPWPHKKAGNIDAFDLCGAHGLVIGEVTRRLMTGLIEHDLADGPGRHRGRGIVTSGGDHAIFTRCGSHYARCDTWAASCRSGIGARPK
jgi:hypothetical protein